MTSLRARVALLVGVLVTAAVLALGIASQRAARLEFRATVSSRVVHPSADAPDLSAAFGRGGWTAVEATLRDALGLGGVILAIAPGGTVVHATDTAWHRAGVTPRPDGFTLVRQSGGAREELRVAGGTPVLVEGDTLAFVFPLAGDDAALEVTGPTDEAGFTSGLRRRLLGAGAVVAALGVGLALVLTGRVLAPLGRLSEAATQLGRGDLEARVGALGTRELDQVAHAFDQMAEALERAQAARQRMVRDVAHELRTPLTSLRGQVEALQDGLRPIDRAALEALGGEVRVLERLVGDLAELARADADALELRPEPVALADAVAAVVRGFVRARRLQPAQVDVEVADGLVVRADPVRLSQMLRNLVDNALVHGGDGVRVTLRAVRGPHSATVEVADDGPGMDPAVAARAFDRLFRGDPSRTRPDAADGGSGLGLSIVQELARAQGGDATLECPPEGGTRVRITLPLA